MIMMKMLNKTASHRMSKRVKEELVRVALLFLVYDTLLTD